MKNTKDNIIKLLEAMNTAQHELATCYEKNSPKYNEHLAEASAYTTAINLLLDNKFFNDLNDIYMEG